MKFPEHKLSFNSLEKELLSLSPLHKERNETISLYDGSGSYSPRATSSSKYGVILPSSPASMYRTHASSHYADGGEFGSPSALLTHTGYGGIGKNVLWANLYAPYTPKPREYSHYSAPKTSENYSLN